MFICPSRNDRRLLLFVLLNIFIVNAGFKLVAHFVFHTGINEMRDSYLDLLFLHQHIDSWGPMLGVTNFFLAHPTLPVYQAPLPDTMNYPLTSVLPLLWMKRSGMSDEGVYHALAVASWITTWAVVGLQVTLASKLAGRGKLTPRAALATALAALFFMPITLAYSLGQAQIFVDLFFTLMVLFWFDGRERPAGAMAALLAMVKPQFALLLIWMALRKRWGALVSALVPIAVGTTLAVAIFGLKNNVSYFGVLSGLSREARSHYANQSLSGLLNRAIFNGENLLYHPYLYPPSVPWIGYLTALATVLLVLLALLFPWRERAGGMADLCAMGVVCVIATPVAWEHHYGVMLPIFVWLWFGVYRLGYGTAWKLALAFVLIGDFLSPLNQLASVPVANVLQSYMYFGALLLLGLLLGAQTPPASGALEEMQPAKVLGIS
jgi:alpha-1,2-mannosyltransferase